MARYEAVNNFQEAVYINTANPEDTHMQSAIGIDIGGTKISVTLGAERSGDMEFLASERFDTKGPYMDVLDRAAAIAERLLNDYGRENVTGIGISCGGPLDSRRGIILSPPNLPGWDGVFVTDFFTKRLGLPAYLRNDADACALAEWKYGAGRGLKNVIFLTFGTGLGAGLILGGRLYSGSSDMAGECGHIRLSEHGPAGYGKVGAFEGFCSGGGIAQLGATMAHERIQQGHPPAYCSSLSQMGSITAKSIADAANAGDTAALNVYRLSGEMLGRGLAILVDLLNPEMIIIGSIFARSRELLWPHALRILSAEALPRALAACRVVPAELGERLGDYAAVALGLYGEDERSK